MLNPIDEPSAPRWLAPVLAIAAVALILAVATWLITTAIGGDSNDSNPKSEQTPVAALANVSPTSELAPTNQPAATQPTSGGVQPTPTVSVPSNNATEVTDSGSGETIEKTSARAWLPGLSALPEGFQRTEDDRRTNEQVASAFPDPEAATANLDAWGWEQNAYRVFEKPTETNPDPSTTTYINVSVHMFGDDASASEAVPFFVQGLIDAGLGFENAEGPAMGDEAVTITSASGGNSVVIYIRTGQFLIRVWGTSPTGDPTADVMALAEAIIS